MTGRKPSHEVRSGAVARLPKSAVALLMRIGDAGPDGLDPAQAGAAGARLEERDLARAGVGGRLVLTEAGAAHLKRARGGAMGFMAQHRRLAHRTISEEGVALVDLDESPLAWLARRKDRDGNPLLQPHEVAAGERLRADFTRGQMSPRVTANWESSVASGRRGGAGASADLADIVVAARMRVSRALTAVGPELSGALVDVCCFLKGLEEVERERRWPARCAKLVLGLGLARLARHYGYAPEAASARGEGVLVAWRAPATEPADVAGGPERA